MRYLSIFVLSGFSFFASGASSAEAGKALWEYGIGAGYVRYPHYPSSDQHEDLFLPFPTFQYRGKILRADDREGGRAYILKARLWSLEFSGSGNLPIESSKNKARNGMEDLPLVAEFGPQLVYAPSSSWEFKWALFPSVTADGFFIRQNGITSHLQAQYEWEKESGTLFNHPLILSGQISLNMKAASQEFHQTYFGVESKDSSFDRQPFHADAGFLSFGLSYFQRFSFGRTSFYAAVGHNDYSHSANKDSPLHRSDSNMTYAIAFTYKLGESKRRAIPVEETEGIINRAHQRGLMRMIPFH